MNFDIKEEDASHARQNQAYRLWNMKQTDYSNPSKSMTILLVPD